MVTDVRRKPFRFGQCRSEIADQFLAFHGVILSNDIKWVDNMVIFQENSVTQDRSYAFLISVVVCFRISCHFGCSKHLSAGSASGGNHPLISVTIPPGLIKCLRRRFFPDVSSSFLLFFIIWLSRLLAGMTVSSLIWDATNDYFLLMQHLSFVRCFGERARDISIV